MKYKQMSLRCNKLSITHCPGPSPSLTHKHAHTPTRINTHFRFAAPAFSRLHLSISVNRKTLIPTIISISSSAASGEFDEGAEGVEEGEGVTGFTGGDGGPAEGQRGGGTCLLSDNGDAGKEEDPYPCFRSKYSMFSEHESRRLHDSRMRAVVEGSPL